MHINPHLLLLSRMLQNPRSISTVVASSRYLGQSIAQNIPAGDGMVIELGGGTGSITRSLLSVVRPEQLIVIERDLKLHRYLSLKFPELRIVHGDAEQLASIVAEHLAKNQRIKAVVSGLPLLSMSLASQQSILEAVFNVIGDKGVFVQFTYGVSCPVSPLVRERFHLQAKSASRVWRNIPPAQVWTLTQNKRL